MKLRKNAQEQKYKILATMPKKAQEEMVGFALIVIIIAVILLILLAFWLRSPQKQGVESYEVESFIQATLQFTTDCRDNFRYLSVQNLLFECSNSQTCSDGRNSCDVLEDALLGIIEESWKIQGDRPVKGYLLNISSNEEEILLIKQGNITNNYKGSVQTLSKAGNDIEMHFSAYY